MNADELKRLTTESLDHLSAALAQGHSERLSALLKTMAQFHRYSFHNVCLIARQRPDAAKLSPYECGFEPFEDARSRFDVRFYLVAILFIIFDLEVAFLFPWAVAFGKLGATGFWSMFVFLAVLTVGFAYEWKKGALEWD